MGVVGSISIRDNASSVLKRVRTEQTTLRKDAADTRKELKRTWGKTYTAKLDTASAVKKVNELTGKVKQFGKKVASPVIRVKDAATSKVNKIKRAITGVAKKVTTPVIKLKDMATKELSSIGSKVKKLAKTTVIPVTAAVTIATAALGGAISSGMELENQQISIEHFIGSTNKNMNAEQVAAASNEYIKALRNNSNATPFETGEVIQAGARAVSISGGDTGSAMDLVKLAEDMAAASGGTKSLSDAMEALADAKLGEMERLKEFGFKISAEEFDTKGFEGISADLNNFFGGAASKLAESGSGLVSTIKGKLKSSIADIGLGIVEKLKPTLNKTITLIDTAQPYFDRFGGAIADGIGKGIDTAASILPVFISGLKSVAPVVSAVASGFTSILPQFTSFGSRMITIQTVVSTIENVIAQAAPIIAGLVQSIGTVVSALAPVFNTIFSEISEKVGSVLSFVGERMGFIQEVIGTVAPLMGDIISTAWGVISPVIDTVIGVFKILFSLVQKVFPGIQSIIETVWGVIKPLVEGIGSVIGKIAGWFGSVADAISGSGSDTGSVGKNAEGDNNWKGGLTWVGEKGAELVDLPQGSRILPHKESIALAGQRSGVVKGSTANIIQNKVVSGGGQDLTPVMMILTSIDANLKLLIDGIRGKGSSLEVPGSGKSEATAKGFKGSVTVTIAKLADEIIVREDEDIDEIADKVAKKVLEVAVNMG